MSFQENFPERELPGPWVGLAGYPVSFICTGKCEKASPSCPVFKGFDSLSGYEKMRGSPKKTF